LLRCQQLLGFHPLRLPAVLVVAALLHVANRRAKQRGAFALAHCQQGDFKLKVDEFFDDDFLAVAAHTGACKVPTGLHIVGRLGHALALAR
jgi:hypothetical protein